jgi:hypothetical protein
VSDRSPRNTALTWALTALVLGVGGFRAWTAMAPTPSAAAPPPTPPPIAAPSSSGDFTFDEDLGDLRRMRWTAVTGSYGEPWDGKLTLHYSDRVHEAYPVVEGVAEVVPHPIELKELARSHRLGVEFEGHPLRTVPFDWLAELAPPDVLAVTAEATRAQAVVRNRSISPLTIRLRAGWRLDDRWLDGAEGGPRCAGLVDVSVPAGGTATLEIAYAEGPEGAVLAPPIVRPIF